MVDAPSTASVDRGSPVGSERDPPPIRRRSLHSEVTRRLRDMIVEGRLIPGERINERALCERLGVSRTPLREALKVLANEGLIELLPNRGTRVSRVTVEEVAELFEAISGIERIGAELAAQRITDREAKRLRDLHTKMYAFHQARERQRYFRLNERIHKAIVALGGNSILDAIHAKLLIQAKRIRYRAILSQSRWDESVAEHEAILEALTARDAPRAGALIQQHTRETGEVVCAALLEDRLSPADK